ncbi:AAA family ATPase (plasmid) [Streptomyces sp. SYP-A7193]|nr:AAA family ATPase [Streptomyces sp. SYP-A7193]
MWYSTLGPLEVLRDGHAIDLGPRQRRVLLTRLLVEDGRPVSLTELCRSLWHEEQPAAAVASVRAHISRLRAALEPDRRGSASVLISSAFGYSLKAPCQTRDTVVFERSLDRAREALGLRDLALARQEIDTALGLWRGDALGEAAEYSFALREASRLKAAHQEARELQTTILLQQGEVEHAVRVAEHLTVTAPLREVSWALLVRALYGAGRPVEALRQYERFRGMLAQELGLDPSPVLRKLHTAVLRHDTAALGLPRSSRYANPSAAPSATAPPPRAPLVGRKEEVAGLLDMLKAAAGGRVHWAVVCGDPGTGKTRLLEEATALADRAGFAVVRAGGGPGPYGDRTTALHCLSTSASGAARAPGADDGTRDGSEKVLGDDPVTALVREVTRTPTLCVVDDLDRADPHVPERLSRVAAVLRNAPVVFVCAVRDPAAPTVGAMLAEVARLNTAWLQLKPFTVADVEELLADRGERDSAADAEDLHRRSRGNPFALGELLKLPREQRSGPKARVPATVGAVVRAQLNEVAPPVRTLLSHAAVDGGVVDIAVLASIGQTEHARLLESVDEAVTAQLLLWQEDPDIPASGRYLLPELVRDVLLDSMSVPSRQLLHAALARELAGREGTDPERLAGHLRAAGPLARSVEAGRSHPSRRTASSSPPARRQEQPAATAANREQRHHTPDETAAACGTSAARVDGPRARTPAPVSPSAQTSGRRSPLGRGPTPACGCARGGRPVEDPPD